MPDDTSAKPVLQFEKPHFEVKLFPDVLTLHVREAAIGDFDKLAEDNPNLRDTLRWLYHTIVPLKVKLEDIENVKVDQEGRVVIKIPMRKDIHIPLARDESEVLAEKLVEMCHEAKELGLEKKEKAVEAREETEFQKDEGYPYIRKPA
jgi:hypothetical protein